MKKLLISSAALLATPCLFATTVAQWTFETTSASITGSSTTLSGIAAETGSGTASGVHASAATWSSPAGNGSAHSFSVNTWAVGDYSQFQLSTVGFSGLSLSYDQTSSTTGPRDFNLSYSLDGTTFTQIGSTYSVLPNSAPNAWNTTTSSSLFTFSYDLGSTIDNSPTVYFRITDADTTSANGGTVAVAGTDRIDNFTVFTTPVPEPTLATLFGLGGLGLLLRRKMKA